MGGVIGLARNLMRRKLRTTLTVVGISVGIWALVVMGSMANKIGALVEGGSIYFKGKIIVSDASSPAFGLGFTPIPIETAGQIQEISGVAVAVPEVQMLLDPDDTGAGFGIPDFIVGSVAGADQGHERFEIKAAVGRLITAGDEGANVVVLGTDLARKFDKAVGGKFKMRGREFDVIGVLEPTLTAPDTTAVVPLQAAQDLQIQNSPIIIKQEFGAYQLATQIVVYPEDGIDVTALAETIETQIEQVQTVTGEDFDEQIGSTVAIFNAIIVGVALISLVVGGLSVVNTMAMSVAEQTREIGIKRAIGASKGRIMREIVSEAGVVGLIGGIIGLLLGAAVVLVANEAGRASGTVLFQLTAGTALFALVFSTALGMLAGLIPAWNAARLDPVDALRYE